jgi:hypothetical protein
MILDQAIAEVQQIAGWRSDKVPQITNALSYAQTEREKPNRTYPWFLRKTNDQAIVTYFGQMQYPIPSDYIEDTEELAGNLYIYLMSSPGPGPSTQQVLLGADGAVLLGADGAVLLSGGGSVSPPNPPGAPNSRTVFLKKQSFEHAQQRYFGEWPYVYYNPAGILYDTGSEIGPGVPRDYYLGDTFVLLYPPPDGIYFISWRYWAQDAPQALGQENKWLKNAPWVLIGDAATKICADLQYAGGMTTAQGIAKTAEENLFRATINRGEAGRRRKMGSRL